MLQKDIFNLIKKTIADNDIVLFMKGTKQYPQCGYSSRVVSILDQLNLDFKDINILSNEELRTSLKEYTKWPTFPQLYIKNEFIGGCDIVCEMYKNGELTTLLKIKEIIK